MTIALTGSTGHVGGGVARRLADLAPRLIVRDAARAPDGPWESVRTASYADTDAARRALDGVDVLFMVSGSESPTRRAEHRSMITAAADAGVRHLVYTSFFGASPDAIFTLGRDHADAEAAITDSGMRFTILRDNFYSDLLPFFADENGVIRGPAGEGRVAAVGRADVVDAAVAIMREPAPHENARYELTGPQALTLDEVAARAAIVLGRPLSYERETEEEAYASRRAYSTEAWQLDAWVSTYTAIRDGEVDRVSGDVERLTGHPARTIEESLVAANTL